MTEPDQNDYKPKKDIEQYILDLLKKEGKLTTQQIKEKTENAGLSCPDEPVRFLNKLRIKGMIQGKISMEQKGWLWWV
jgi:hypothetical protein